MTLELLLAVLGVASIFVLSLVEAAIVRLSKVSLRVLAERERGNQIALLEEIASDRRQFLLPLQFSLQVLTAVVAIAACLLAVESAIPYPYLTAVGVMVALVALLRQLAPRLLVEKDPERLLLTLLPFLAGVYRVLSWLTAPIVWLLRRARKGWYSPQRPAVQEEASDEEIQAYLDVGTEEGIFEPPESDLIQSALEFGTTLVREIMTPRSEIVAIEEKATIADLKDLIVSSKHSRIPVYHDRLEQIVGVVYVRNLLAYLESNRGKELIAPLIKPALYVPETKKVSELLKEMQQNSEQMALVVNEYGAVSGLVTIEDLVEEIVGEIYDEDELQVVDLEKEPEGTYLALGSLEIGDLEDALAVDFGPLEVTTVSGLVVQHLGRVPEIGARVELDQIDIEVLEADPKRILKMRIRHQSLPPLRAPSRKEADEPPGH